MVPRQGPVPAGLPGRYYFFGNSTRAIGRPRAATVRAPSSMTVITPNAASHSRMAFSRIASNTGARSLGEELMTCEYLGYRVFTRQRLIVLGGAFGKLASQIGDNPLCVIQCAVSWCFHRQTFSGPCSCSIIRRSLRRSNRDDHCGLSEMRISTSYEFWRAARGPERESEIGAKVSLDEPPGKVRCSTLNGHSFLLSWPSNSAPLRSLARASHKVSGA